MVKEISPEALAFGLPGDRSVHCIAKCIYSDCKYRPEFKPEIEKEACGCRSDKRSDCKDIWGKPAPDGKPHERIEVDLYMRPELVKGQGDTSA
jgi:hypothetical protein